MSVNGEIHAVTPVDRTMVGSHLQKQAGFTAGSRAVDSLDRMITSIESFFHPTTTGPWTLSVRFNLAFKLSCDVCIDLDQQLTAFIQRLVSGFQPACSVPPSNLGPIGQGKFKSTRTNKQFGSQKNCVKISCECDAVGEEAGRRCVSKGCSAGKAKPSVYLTASPPRTVEFDIENLIHFSTEDGHLSSLDSSPTFPGSLRGLI
jgi:hypothetical protein